MKQALLLLTVFLCLNTYAQYRWAYIGGNKFGSQNPRYTAGFFTPAQPGSRTNLGAYWADRDANGQMWFFGGQGVVGSGSYGYNNELWKLDPDGAAVTFMGGSQIINAAGTYSGPTLWPCSRSFSTHCLAADGKLWMYGGINSGGQLSDLWQYDPLTTNKWTLITGTAANNQAMPQRIPEQDLTQFVGWKQAYFGFSEVQWVPLLIMIYGSIKAVSGPW